MPCYRPLTAYIGMQSQIVFRTDLALMPSQPFDLPCGRCLGCRLEKAKQWALRCWHEASLYEHGLNNCFITLTYAPEHLPKNHELVHEHFQKFIRSLRKISKQKIRYFMCGEYGEATEENNWIARPHYHAIIFGYKFKDALFFKERNGNRVYRSKLLDTIWGKGDTEIGSVTFQSAGYVARYILEKQEGTPEQLFLRYAIVNPDTGEMKSRKLEYTRMSLKKGIGEKWFEQNYSDCFPHDYCVLPDGRQTSVPTYYRNLLKKNDPALWEELRTLRIEKAKNDPNSTPARLAVREQCKTAQINRLPRNQI